MFFNLNFNLNVAQGSPSGCITSTLLCYSLATDLCTDFCHTSVHVNYIKQTGNNFYLILKRGKMIYLYKSSLMQKITRKLQYAKKFPSSNRWQFWPKANSNCIKQKMHICIFDIHTVAPCGSYRNYSSLTHLYYVLNHSECLICIQYKKWKNPLLLWYYFSLTEVTKALNF